MYLMSSVDKSLILNTFDFNFNLEAKAFLAIRLSEMNLSMNHGISRFGCFTHFTGNELEGTKEASCRSDMMLAIDL